MAFYKVKASYLTYCEVIIEADNDNDAIEKASELDGGDFSTQSIDDWQIDSVSSI